jgi:hypothetical protein
MGIAADVVMIVRVRWTWCWTAMVVPILDGHVRFFAEEENILSCAIMVFFITSGAYPGDVPGGPHAGT